MKGPHQLDEKIAYRYQIKGFVGEGGMQYVYCGWDLTLNRYVALKTPKNLSAEKRFHRSAIVSAKVNHPNIAKTLDYLEENGKYSANHFTDHFFSKVLKFLFRGYTQISLIGTLIFPGGPSFPLPLVCPTLHQLAAL